MQLLSRPKQTKGKKMRLTHLVQLNRIVFQPQWPGQRWQRAPCREPRCWTSPTVKFTTVSQSTVGQLYTRHEYCPSLAANAKFSIELCLKNLNTFIQPCVEKKPLNLFTQLQLQEIYNYTNSWHQYFVPRFCSLTRCQLRRMCSSCPTLMSEAFSSMACLEESSAWDTEKSPSRALWARTLATCRSYSICHNIHHPREKWHNLTDFLSLFLVGILHNSVNCV